MQAAHAHKGKRNANCQRVDTGCQRHPENKLRIARIKGFAVPLFPDLERFTKHADAQKSQNRKSDPVIHVIDLAAKMKCPKPAHEWIDNLEETERQRDQQNRPPLNPLQGHATGNGNGKTVHRQTQGKTPNFKAGHKKTRKR